MDRGFRNSLLRFYFNLKYTVAWAAISSSCWARKETEAQLVILDFDARTKGVDRMP